MSAEEMQTAMAGYFKQFRDLRVTVKDVFVWTDGAKAAIEWDWDIIGEEMERGPSRTMQSSWTWSAAGLPLGVSILISAIRFDGQALVPTGDVSERVHLQGRQPRSPSWSSTDRARAERNQERFSPNKGRKNKGQEKIDSLALIAMAISSGQRTTQIVQSVKFRRHGQHGSSITSGKRVVGHGDDLTHHQRVVD